VDDLRAQSLEVVKPELEMFLTDLRTELLPTFSSQLTAEFQKRMPELKDTALELAHNLEDKIRLRAEERLIQSMIKGFETSETEIQLIFPAFTSENLEKQIGQSMDYYVDNLHDSLEERISYISSSLDALKATIREVGKSDDMKPHLPKTKEEAEEQVLDSILDLVVFEIKPALGDELAK
jgi:Rad3-related DNA helicase